MLFCTGDIKKKSRESIRGSSFHLLDSAFGGGARLSTTAARSVYAEGVRTLNGFVTYAMCPSGRTTNSERVSRLFLASYAAYSLPTLPPRSLAKSTRKSSSRAHDATAVSG